MSCLRLIGRLIALFIILVLVAITPPLIMAYNAQQAAVSSDFLDELFEEPDLFEELIPEMAEDLARETKDDPETRDKPIARLSADDWERIIYAVAPPETMQRWSQDAVTGFRRWIRRGGRFLDDAIIPFGEIRDNIVDDPEQTVLRTLTQAQSECSSDQEPLDGPDGLIPQCRPPAARLEAFYQRLNGRWRDQPREVWRQMMPEGIARYPNNISLADFIEEESGEEIWEVRYSWRVSRWGLRVAQWLLGAFIAAQCVVALGLVALLAAHNWREALRWIGTPIVLIGAFTLLFALLFFVGGEIGTWFIPDDEVPIGVQKVIKDSAHAFSDELWPPMMWQGGVLILIGLGLWVLSFFAPRRYEPAPIPVTAPTAPPVSEPIETALSQETAPAEHVESEAIASEESVPTETDANVPKAPDQDETATTAIINEDQEPSGDLT